MKCRRISRDGLTGEELRRLTPPASDGFLSVFKRAWLGNPLDGPLVAQVVDRLGDVQSKLRSLGPETLCVAISTN